jgi:competence protein ComEC
MLGFLILGIVLISVFWRYKKLAIMGFCILFLAAGIWRHQAVWAKGSRLADYNDKETVITLTGIVSAEPDFREKSQKIIIDAEQLATGNNQSAIPGKVLLTVSRYPEYQYGDKLKITGKLESPSADIDGFNYQEYLKKDGIYSVMSFPETELAGKNLGNPLYAVLFSFKNKFKETTRQFISPPKAGILEALIFGDEEKISQEWKDKLNFTGTRHITAVSGMNITIICSLVLGFFLSIGFWRRQAFYISIVLIVVFILMIGAPASVVRAGIMAGFFLLAQHLGRMSAGQRALVFAATFMLALNPLLLKLDVGFQLSFLAVLGMIYFQSFFSGFLKKIPNFKFFPVRTTLSSTVAAQIFTLPILVYNFGYVPLASPVTNVLIVPFLAPLTILIFIFGLAGMIFSVLGWILFWPVWMGLTYVTVIINQFSKISFASVGIDNIHWFWLVIFYSVLAVLTWKMQEKQKLNFLKP